MKGSYSIKKVLPALVSKLSYATLNISEGRAASNTFAKLYSEIYLEKISQIRADLLAYCKMDTMAMVEIHRFLINLNVI